MFYINYDGYEKRFGSRRRPTVVRYSKINIYNRQLYCEEVAVYCKFFIDGKSFEQKIEGNYQFDEGRSSVALLVPTKSPKGNLSVQRFDPNSKEDWIDLFQETQELDKASDRLSFAYIAIALNSFSINKSVIIDALCSFQSDVKDKLISHINYVAYGLSIDKIKQIRELNVRLGQSADHFFPPILIDAAEQCGIIYNGLNVHSLADQLFVDTGEPIHGDITGFIRFIRWLNGEDIKITIQELETCFAFLGERRRPIAIKRFFYDVKNGRLPYDEQSLKAFSSNNLKYYSTIRYIIEKWPADRNVSTDFLLDCLDTYKKTDQQLFQISDGILDWAIQKAIELGRPLEMKFYDWLCYCKGGIIINPEFKGFASFDIQYELDDFAFEEESVKNNVQSIIAKYCEQQYHTDTVEQIDQNTGHPIIDRNTNKPLTMKQVVYEDRWKLKRKDNKKYIDLFVNWSKLPESEKSSDVFTLEMIDYSIVRDNVEKYLLDKYGTTTPYISEREPDSIVKMFAYETRMRAIMDNSVTLGDDPGIDIATVKQKVLDRMIELFGESLDCEYNQTNYNLALSASLFRRSGGSTSCFTKKTKFYYHDREIYCAPFLSELPSLLTNKKFAECQHDPCFLTSIEKEPDWKRYTLIHILEIIGYKVLEETEAGYMPCQTYNQFVNQINKAIRFYKRLVCRECGHILFPTQTRSHSRFKCLVPTCTEYNKEVYLNYCYNCKTGLIDSRDTKQCPNGLYICPSCNSCCSNALFESQASKYRILGRPIPVRLSRIMGNGHYELGMHFCNKCGAQIMMYYDQSGNKKWRCPHCDTTKNEASSKEGIS